jgi:predicted ABC-type ATPase
MKEIIIIGGANGSGKTTFARELVAESGVRYLGADEIAAELNAESPEIVAIEAARIFSKRLDQAIENGESLGSVDICIDKLPLASASG